MKKLIRSIVAGLTICLGATTASFASEYKFNIMGRSDIEQEITIAKLLPFYQYMGGSVEIQWANPDLTPVIKNIENTLIKEGVHRQDIVRNFSQHIANSYQSRDSINLILKTLKSRNNCIPYSLDASEDFLGQGSCAIDDNLEAMKIRK